MISYYLSASNEITIRVQPTASSELTLVLEDMYSLVTSSYSLSGSYDYSPYESILTFSQSLSASVGDEYRAYIYDVSGSIWNGTIQVYASQSVDKTQYKNQNDGYISNISDNQYITL
jgi:hypothetical protein